MTSGGGDDRTENPPNLSEHMDFDRAGIDGAATPQSLPFVNEPIVVPGIPTLDGAAFSKLDPRYRTLRLLTAAIGGVVPVVAALVVSIAMSLPGVLEAAAVGVAVVILALRVVFAWFEYPYRGWLLRNHDVSFRQGIIGRSITTVPFSRVQHVAVSRSGISRAFGLASVDLFTAGSGVADLSIPGLDLSEAERLREHVLMVIRGGVG